MTLAILCNGRKDGIKRQVFYLKKIIQNKAICEHSPLDREPWLNNVILHTAMLRNAIQGSTFKQEHSLLHCNICPPLCNQLNALYSKCFNIM